MVAHNTTHNTSLLTENGSDALSSQYTAAITPEKYAPHHTAQNYCQKWLNML